MVASLEQFGIDRLAVEDRLELIGLIWDSVAGDRVPTPIPEWHRLELERRVSEADANPGAGLPWEAVRARILSAS